METEKNKIEFWESDNDPSNLNDYFIKHKPAKPFLKPVKISVTMVYKADCEISKPSMKGANIRVLLAYICDCLEYFGYIRHDRQIQSLFLEDTESNNPGISFFMQEVE